MRFAATECCEIRHFTISPVAGMPELEYSLDRYSLPPTTPPPLASSFFHALDNRCNELRKKMAWSGSVLRPHLLCQGEWLGLNLSELPPSNSEIHDNPAPSPFQLYSKSKTHDNPLPSPFQLPHSNSKTHHNPYSLQKPTTSHTHLFDNNILSDRTKQFLHAPPERPTVPSFHPLIYAPSFVSWFSMMQFIDIFSLILSFLGLYGIVFSLRLLLPRNVVPLVSTSLNETMALLENAEATNIPNVSDYRVDLAMYVSVHIGLHNPQLIECSHHNRFLQMRTESHRSPEFFQQVCLFFLCGLTWRLRSLKSEIEDIKRKIEV